MQYQLPHSLVCQVSQEDPYSGITGRKLFEQYPQLRRKLWKGQLWNHSYYCETVGSVSGDIIRRYIDHQSKAY